MTTPIDICFTLVNSQDKKVEPSPKKKPEDMKRVRVQLMCVAAIIFAVDTCLSISFTRKELLSPDYPKVLLLLLLLLLLLSLLLLLLLLLLG